MYLLLNSKTLMHPSLLGSKFTRNRLRVQIHRREVYHNYEVEAHLYSDSRKVEVNLFNIGNAYVSIVDANGMLVDSIDVSTDMPRTVMLNVAVRGGHYYLIISSSAIYAEGHFSL